MTTESRAPQEMDLARVRDDAGLVVEWNELASQSEHPCYFRSADWVCSWWETVAARPPTRVAVWRDGDGRLRALAAISAGRERLHRRAPFVVPVARVAGSGPGDADHCGPLVDPQWTGLVPAVVDWMRAAAGRRAFVCTGVVPATARLVERVACPRIALSGSSECAGRSSNFRVQLGKFERRLQRAGVEFTWHPPGTPARENVDALVELHHRRRQNLAQPTSLDERHRALLHACADRGDPGRGVAAVVAAKGDEVVGVLLGFWSKGWFGAYQSGWDPAYAPHSIGSVLVANAVRNAAEHGAHTFDFLRGAESYKYRFGAFDAYDATYVVPGGASARLLITRAAVRTWRRDRRASRLP